MKFIRFFFPIICLVFLFSSCREEKSNTNANIQMADLKEWREEKFHLRTSRIRHTIDSLKLQPATMYADKYARKYYTPDASFLWITRSGIDERADTLLTYLQEASATGLPEKAFHLSEIQASLQRIRELEFTTSHNINHLFGYTEFLLTKAYLRYVCGQRFGYIDPNFVFNRLEQADTTEEDSYIQLYNIPTEKVNDDFIQEAFTVLKEGKLPAFFQQIEPTAQTYRQLKEIYRETPSGELKDKIAVNMERSRWRIPETENKYIWVNLANMNLYAISPPDTIEMKVCIGNRRHKTPMLSSRIERMDLNPYWNIPYSIIKKEIAPLHAGDKAYFARNRYRIFNKATGEEHAPETMTASMLTSGEYRVRQDNGDENSLGRLIFRFPNPFSIYLHDTNNKRAFTRSQRAISHGCIRVEKPLDLAVFLMEKPDEESINKLRVATGYPPLDGSPLPASPEEELKVSTQYIKPSIPLFIHYHTFYPQAGNKWKEYPDTYGYDEILLTKLKAL